MNSIDRGPSIPRVMAGAQEIVPARHPKHAYIDRDGYRSLDMEASVFPRKDGAIVYCDVHDRRQPVAVVVELPAEGVEWLLDELPSGDRFTKALAYARDLAKVIAWDRASGRVA